MRKFKFIYAAIILIQVFCITSSIGQVQTTLRPPPSNQLLATDLLQLSLNNTSPSGYTVVITGAINDDQDTELLQFRTMPFQLNNGLTILQEDAVTIAQIIYSNTTAGEMLHATGLLPTGIYKACVKVLDYQNNNELGTACINQPINEFMHPKQPKKIEEISVTNTEKKPNELNKHIQFYGTGSLEGSGASQQGYHQTIPPNYFRADLRPGAEIAGAPLQLNLFYSTEESRTRQQMFIANLSFDETRFKNNLRNMLVEKLKKEGANMLAENGIQLNKLKDLENYKAALSEPSLLHDAANLDKLQSMKSELKTIGLERFDQLSETGGAKEKALLEKYNSLKTQYGDVSVLESRQIMLDKLKGKVNELQSFKDKLEKSGALEKLQSLEKYDMSKLSDPQEMAAQLNRLGLFKGANRNLFGVKRLGIGNVFPSYSPLILDGIQVIGATVEINPGLLYVAATMGKSKRIATNTDLPFSAYDQNIIAGKFGFGKTDQTHLYFTFLRGIDKIRSDIPDTINTLPESNFILGVEFQNTNFKKTLIFKGEAALNEFIRDNRATEADLIDNPDLAGKIPLFIAPNTATLLDYAYNGSAELNLFKHSTVLSYRMKYIGPGYRSFGAPFLNNDVRQQEARIDQRLLKNQLILSAFYRADLDNLLNFKGIKTQSNYYGLSLDVRVRKLPYLRVQYAPSSQINTSYNSSLQLLTLNSGHAYSAGKLFFNTTVAFTSTAFVSNISDVKYNSRFLQATQSVTRSGLTLAMTYIHNTTLSTLGTQQINGADLMCSFRFKKKLRNTFAVTHHQDGLVRKTGFWYDLSYPILPTMNAGIHLRYNDLKDPVEISNQYAEFLGRVRITFNFGRT